MKDASTAKVKDKVSAEGFDPDSIANGVSNQFVKVMTMAALMSSTGTSLTKKKLLCKTEACFMSKHLAKMDYLFATTVLVTHIIEGPVPKNSISTSLTN